MNHTWVERMIWGQEGLKVPHKQPKKGRLWLNDGSCIRFRPERKKHLWIYALMAARTQAVRIFRILMVTRRITAQEVIYELGDLFLGRGIPEHIRSDNGPEFTAREIRQWLKDLGANCGKSSFSLYTLR